MSGWSEIGSVRLIRLESPGYKGPETKKPVSENRFFCLMAEREGFEPSMGFKTHTPLAGERLQPLGHLSNSIFVFIPGFLVLSLS